MKVGNPYLDVNRNIKGGLDFLWTHAMMSDEVYVNVTKNCDFDNLSGTLRESMPRCFGRVSTQAVLVHTTYMLLFAFARPMERITPVAM